MNENLNVARLISGYEDSVRSRLEAQGVLQTGCGDTQIALDAISFSSAVGGKTENDDYIAFWQPHKSVGLHWAVAIADGVTGCILPSEAARLACLLGLSTIERSFRRNAAGPDNPFALVLRVFRQLGRRIQSAPEKFVPSTCQASTWKVAVRRGKFLQTTLNLIWADDAGLRIMAIGDGGILYSYSTSPNQVSTQSFGSGKLSAIGPVGGLPAVESYLLEDWATLICHTDGVSDLLDFEPESAPALCNARKTVEAIIDEFCKEHSDLIEDNLSTFRSVKVTQ